MENNQKRGVLGNKNNKPTTPTDLQEIKTFLQALKEELINLTITPHSKKEGGYREANYRPKNQILFVDTRILEEIQTFRKSIIKDNNIHNNNHSKPLSSNSLKTHFDNFQINYKNIAKDAIKETIGKIDINKLTTLRLFPLDPDKCDKFNNLIKTNYKKGLNIIYYRQEDLKHINFFITRAKQGYRVKKLHPMHKYLLKSKV
ncbi:Conserved hypothetical protein [Candidatus Phytoplasma australiense]|uniref:Uncharacterized protein n=1 Tax=Phytoplasma australiense TaxID=59748 RepID=B1V9R7_PHYAS|nr:Conserved hypothetical protein [Candidatus Phytoplasma australiense]